MSTIHPSIQMRSIYVSTLDDCADPAIDLSNNNHEAQAAVGNIVGDNLSSEEDPIGNCTLEQKEERDDVKDDMQLPQSTHTLFFTENLLSLPFAFGTVIVAMSCLCLILVLLNNLHGGSEGNVFDVPANVSTHVRAAQYLSILVALLMEEGEI